MKLIIIIFVISFGSWHQCCVSGCVQLGNNCGWNYEDCCNGLTCNSAGVCVTSSCKALNTGCSVDDDCCPGLYCSSNVCSNKPDPCIQKNQDCSIDSNNCCSGLRCEESNGDWTCQSTSCSNQGQTCNEDDDCCSGLNCKNGVCADKPSPCFQLHQDCWTALTGCCEGLRCEKMNGNWSCEVSPPHTTTTQPTPPSCAHQSDSCNYNTDCCTGLECSQGECQPIPPPTRAPCGLPQHVCYKDADCCSGLRCTNQGMCQQPPPTRAPCGLVHGVCYNDGDCCKGLQCSDSGFCEPRPPTTTTSTRPSCASQDKQCYHDDDCCTGLNCSNGFCEPSCTSQGNQCGSTFDCCSGLVCSEDETCEPPPRPTTSTSTTTTSTSTTTTSTSTTSEPTSPCFQRGISCMTSPMSCCSGLACVHTKDNEFICETSSPTSSPGCTSQGQTCDEDGDCCEGLSCSGGVCASSSSPSPCFGSGANCLTNVNGCCTGLTCNSKNYLCESSASTTQPPTTTQSCLAINANCGGEGVVCCDGLICYYGLLDTYCTTQ